MSKLFDRYAGLGFLIIGAAFMIESRRISESAYGSQVGPDIFPFGLGLVLALLSARLIYETFKYPAASKDSKATYDVKRFAILFGAALLYAISLEQIGYIIDTFLFLLIGFQTMQRGKWWSSLLIAALMSYGVYYVFVDILQGTLPGWPVWLSQ
jgi:putative tricarboxylic transport membrane protein